MGFRAAFGGFDSADDEPDIGHLIAEHPIPFLLSGLGACLLVAMLIFFGLGMFRTRR
jgi:hypothetical protein